MTPAQTRLYWRIWRECERALVDHWGRTPAQAKAMRLEVHRQAGLPESSKAFNARENLDDFLAACWTWSYASSMSHQERQVMQPATRVRYACKLTAHLMNELTAPALEYPYFQGVTVADRAPEQLAIDGLMHERYRALNREEIGPFHDPSTGEARHWQKVARLFTYRYDQIARREMGLKGNTSRGRRWPTTHAANLAEITQYRTWLAQRQTTTSNTPF